MSPGCGRRAASEELAVAQRTISDLQIRTHSPRSPVSTLSGGNQQKVVLGKWLATEPKVMMLDEPTRGVDVGAKAEIYRLLYRDRGAGDRHPRLVVRGARAAHALRPDRRHVPRPHRRRRCRATRRPKPASPTSPEATMRRRSTERQHDEREAVASRERRLARARRGRLVGRQPLRGGARPPRRRSSSIFSFTQTHFFTQRQHREPAHERLDPLGRLDGHDVRRAHRGDRPLGRLAARALRDHARRSSSTARACRRGSRSSSRLVAGRSSAAASTAF